MLEQRWAVFISLALKQLQAQNQENAFQFFSPRAPAKIVTEQLVSQVECRLILGA